MHVENENCCPNQASKQLTPVYITTSNHIRNKILSEIPLQNPICGLPANLREINTTKPQQPKKLLSAPNGQPQLKPKKQNRNKPKISQTNNNVTVSKIKQINKKVGVCGVQPLANPKRGIWLQKSASDKQMERQTNSNPNSVKLLCLTSWIARWLFANRQEI